MNSQMNTRVSTMKDGVLTSKFSKMLRILMESDPRVKDTMNKLLLHKIIEIYG
jgi:hypothetical protein